MIIWIASYPKSGNTWIRSLLSSYLFTVDGSFNFKLLENIKQFSCTNFYPDTKKNEKNYQLRISKNWIPAQKIINQDSKIHFLKTHNAICNISGNNFTNKENTVAVLYIVRDPRNLITSLSHHYEINLDEAFKFLLNERKVIFPTNPGDEKISHNPEDFNFISNWSGHYKSWKNIGFCPIKIIKYEDFLENTTDIFISILNFLKEFYKVELDLKKISKSLKSTNFENLSNMENTEGFTESITSSKTKNKIKFFNLGKKNDWRKLLDKTIVTKIENNFKNEMKELNYL